ncbi:UNVERIFIED_ORG: hypothetical protein ABIC54_006404 [Burkholderia sp. 1263]
MDRVDYESSVIQDYYNFHKSGELNLNPWYQRRSVWTAAQQAYLVNTLFENKPVPTLYVRHYLDIEKEISIKEVVDGQQRLRAIFGYLNDEFAARHPGYVKAVKYSQLKPTEKTNFKMTKLSIGTLVNASESDVIEIFGRLNSISKTLNPQEKRNARFSGRMKYFCLKLASDKVSFWRSANIFSATDISRMSEVQFISDLTLNLMNGLSDFSPAALDNLYEKYEDEFDEEETIKKRFERTFLILEQLGTDFFYDTIFSRTPIFFSLFIALDQMKNVTARKIEKKLREIDAIFVDDLKHGKADAAFAEASTSTTQRVKNRQIRHQYLLSKLG